MRDFGETFAPHSWQLHFPEGDLGLRRRNHFVGQLVAALHDVERLPAAPPVHAAAAAIVAPAVPLPPLLDSHATRWEQVVAGVTAAELAERHITRCTDALLRGGTLEPTVEQRLTAWSHLRLYRSAPTVYQIPELCFRALCLR